MSVLASVLMSRPVSVLVSTLRNVLGSTCQCIYKYVCTCTYVCIYECTYRYAWSFLQSTLTMQKCIEFSNNTAQVGF